MKLNKTAIVLALVGFMLCASAQAQYAYTTNNGAITITEYTGSGGAVTIPDTINGLPITSIGLLAFQGCTSLISVTIPNSVINIEHYAFHNCASLTAISVGPLNSAYSSVDGVLFNKAQTTVIQYPPSKAGSYMIADSVTTIEGNAFFGCTSLTGVTIPNSVTSIGWGAFYNCTQLASVTIPNSVTDIEDYAFYGCTSLTAIAVAALNPVYCCVDGVLFNKNQTEIIIYPGGKVGSYTIPNSVTDMGFAFSGCTSLTSVTIGNSITSIGNWAFASCRHLTTVTIPDSVTSIGNGAFSDCADLTHIHIPDSVTSIGFMAFSGCTSLTSVTIPNSVINIGDRTFERCKSLTSASIGNSVTSIGYLMFIYCTRLTNVTIGNSVTNIGDYAFLNCSRLTRVTIPNCVKDIGVRAFSGCTSLTGVTISNSITSIGDYAFSGCSSLASVTIPSGVIDIGWEAFSGCSHLASVTIPDSVTDIGGGAFSKCFGLTSITVDTHNPAYNSVDGVLFNKSQTELIICPGGKVGNYTIPNSVANVGYWGFSGCTSLTAITVDALNPVYSSRDGVLFNKGYTELIACPGGKVGSYSIPNSVTDIRNERAFADCSSLTGVIIPNSVRYFSDAAFSDCYSLSSITVEALNLNYSSIDGILFNKSQTEIIQFPPGKAGSWAIPNSVTNIWRAFNGCKSLNSVMIPNSVINIDGWAFGSCTSLTSIAVDALNPVYESVDGVLFNKSQTELIICPRGKAGNYTIPNNVTSIGNYAFYGCTGLTSVMIGDSVTSIGNGAFYGCTGLTGVYFTGNAPNFRSMDSGVFDEVKSWFKFVTYFLAFLFRLSV